MFIYSVIFLYFLNGKGKLKLGHCGLKTVVLFAHDSVGWQFELASSRQFC